MIKIDCESGEDEESEEESDDFVLSDGFEESDFEYDDMLFDDNIDNEIEWVGIIDESSQVIQNQFTEHFRP